MVSLRRTRKRPGDSYGGLTGVSTFPPLLLPSSTRSSPHRWYTRVLRVLSRPGGWWVDVSSFLHPPTPTLCYWLIGQLHITRTGSHSFPVSLRGRCPSPQKVRTHFFCKYVSWDEYRPQGVKVVITNSISDETGTPNRGRNTDVQPQWVFILVDPRIFHRRVVWLKLRVREEVTSWNGSRYPLGSCHW